MKKHLDSCELPARLAGILSKRPRQSLKGRGHRLRESAVLLPLLLSEQGPPELIYIVRHASAPTHSGQIAFPGGKREEDDPSLEHTALRESAEEIGLPMERVELCGLLDDVATIGMFAITPVVGVVRGPVDLLPSEFEVAATFRAPLEALTDCYRHAGYGDWSGVRYAKHEFHFAEPAAQGQAETRLIWGATASITHQLLSLLELLPLWPDPPR